MSELTDPIAPCGIDCGACPIRKAANDAAFAEELANAWRNTSHPAAKAEWFKCQGCHGPENLVWTENCKIRQCCVKDRKLKNCSQCAEFPCQLIAAFETDGYPHHRDAVSRLRKMKEPDSQK